MDIVVTPQLFQAYLECPVKCFRKFREQGEDTSTYSRWLGARDKAYYDAYIAQARGRISSPRINRVSMHLTDNNQTDWRFHGLPHNINTGRLVPASLYFIERWKGTE